MFIAFFPLYVELPLAYLKECFSVVLELKYTAETFLSVTVS